MFHLPETQSEEILIIGTKNLVCIPIHLRPGEVNNQLYAQYHVQMSSDGSNH